MFKFAFDIEDADDEVIVPQQAPKAAPAAVSRAPAQPCHSISLAELIKLLPESFSYTPLAHPLGGAPLLRRDLFDARFQLAQNGTEGEGSADGDAYVDADTDLIPGTYEGGLKSWEGGLDLVEVLARNVAGSSAEGEDEKIAAWVGGSRVLEVGCGTGLPSAYILRALLSAPAAEGTATTVLHVQDYNLPVLSLVTLPNLVLASLTALPPSARTAEAAPEDDEGADDEDEDGEGEDKFEGDDDESVDEPHRPFDPLRAGNLDVTPALLDAFATALEERRVELRFTYGDWSGMAEQIKSEDKYGLVLTAETIYAEESVLPLIDVLRAATERIGAVKENKVVPSANLEDSLGALAVRDDWAKVPLVEAEPVVLVAAKVLYFGVGGGLEAFLDLIRSAGGWSSRVQDWIKGVGRAVVRIGW